MTYGQRRRKTFSNALDRVVRGDGAATSRVVQVKVPRKIKPGVYTFLVYPDGSLSIRLWMLQNGLEAAEKFRILRTSGERPEALSRLSALFDAKKSLWKGAACFSKIRDARDRILNAAPANGFFQKGHLG